MEHSCASSLTPGTTSLFLTRSVCSSLCEHTIASLTSSTSECCVNFLLALSALAFACHFRKKGLDTSMADGSLTPIFHS